MPLSSSEENYIKTIFQLQVSEEMVSTNEVAAVLQTSAASVTDMLKKLLLVLSVGLFAGLGQAASNDTPEQIVRNVSREVLDTIKKKTDVALAQIKIIARHHGDIVEEVQAAAQALQTPAVK